MQVRRSDDASRRSSSCTRSRSSTRTPAAISNAAFDTYARALAEDPANEPTQEGLDRLARATGRFADLARVFEELAAAAGRPELGERALHDERARLRERPRRRRQRDRALPQGARASIRRTSRPPSRSSSSSAAPSATPDLSLILQRKAEILDDPNDKKAALFQAAAIEEDVLERHEQRDRRLQEGPRARPEDDLRASTRSSSSTSGSRAGRTCSRSTRRRPISSPIPTRRSASTTRSARSTSASSATSTRRSTPTSASSSSIPTISRRSGGSTSSTRRRRTGRSCSASSRTRPSCCDDPDEAISYQYRIAELYEKHLDDVARAIELYREILQRRARSRADARRPRRAQERRARIRSAPPSVLEPVYDAIGEWPKLISVLEVQVAHADDPFTKVDLLHRIARLYEESARRSRARRSTRTRARSRSTTATRRRSRTSSGSRWSSTAGRTSRRSTTPSSTSSPRSPSASSSSVCASRRSSRSSSRTSTTPSRATAACSRSTPRTRPRSARSIASSRQTERWARSRARSSRARPRSGRRPTRSSSSSTASARSTSTRLDDLDSAIAAYREVLAAAPEHAPTLEALEGLFAAGMKQIEIGEILEPLYQAAGEWEKLAARLRGAARAPQRTPSRAPRDVLPHRGARRGEAPRSRSRRARASTCARSRSTRSTRSRAKRSSASPASIDGGWEKLANAYADVLGLHDDTTVQRVDRQAPRARLRGGARRHHQGRGDVPLRARRRAARRRSAREPRSHLHLARAVGRARADARAAGQGDRPSRTSSSSSTPASVEVYEERLGQVDDAIRAFRRIFDELDKTQRGRHPGPRAHLRAEGRVDRPQHRLRARARERVGRRRRRPRSARRSRTSLAERLERPAARHRDLEARPRSARRGSRRRSARSPNLYERGGQWAELVRRARAPVRHRRSDDDCASRSSRAARGSSTSSSGATSSALDDCNRVLDIDYANVARSPRDRRDLAPAATIRSELVDGAPPDGRSRRGAARRRGAQGDLPRARQDLRRACSRSRSTRPTRGASSSRSIRATSRPWTRSRAIYRARGAVARGRRRQDAARRRARGPDEQDPRVPRGRRASGSTRSATRTGGTPAYEKILDDRRRRTTRRSSHARGAAHARPARWEPLIELYLARLETREETCRARPTSCAASRASSRRSSTTRARRSTRSSTRSARTSATARRRKYLERMAQATGRWGELIQTANTWLQEQTDPQQKIRLCLRLAKWYGEDLGHPEYAQPYYAQIVAARPEQRRRCCGRWRSFYRKKRPAGSSTAQTLTRALDVAVTDVDRKEILTELGELLERQMSEVDQGARATTSAPSRSIRSTCRRSRRSSASTPTRDAEPRARRRSSTRKVQGAHATPSRSPRTKLRIGGALRDSARASSTRPAQIYREVLEVDAVEPRSPCAASSASTRRRRSSGRSSSASSSSSSTSSPPSASASTS